MQKKVKIKFDFITEQLYSSISAFLSFSESHIQIKITDNDMFANKSKKKELILSLFKPIFQQDDSIHISYALIHKIENLNNNRLRLEIYHPTKSHLVSLEIYKLIEPGLFKDKKLTNDQIVRIETFVQSKKMQVCKDMLEIIDNFIYCLKDGMSNDGIVSHLEDKFYDSMAESKKYYQKALSELKKSDQIKIEMKKKIFEKEKQIKLQSRNVNRLVNNSIVKSNSVNLDKSINIGRSSLLNDDTEITKIVDTIIDDDDDKKYSNYECIFFELKKNSIHFLESTISLFLQILDLDKNLLNLDIINKHNVSKGLNFVKQFETLNRSSCLDKKPTESSIKLNESLSNNVEPSNIKKVKKFFSEKVSQNDKQIVFNSSYTNNQVIINMNLGNEEGKLDNRNIKINNNEEGILIQITLDDNKENKFDSLLLTQQNKNLVPIDKATSKNNKFQKKTIKYEEETPKFFFNSSPRLEPLKNSRKPSKKQQKINLQLRAETQMLLEVNRKIEEIKKNHMFFPPNDYFNIIHNTTEISHRKFYQKCFEDYFNKVFIYENDSFGFINIESIVSYFYYIKGLKNFLYNDANKVFYANMIFMEDD
jgi:hypothetical protein